jgi:ABC-2 type transport system permease protein
MFVTLSGFAAFWPDDFFSTNRANLDQLNYWFPFIMLIFIPAITMSVWAEERQQGTDELLLTVPASDFDIVLGKYLAALAIYSVSLLFSLVCNYWVLAFLGNPDAGLFISTYFGYWLIGLGMLAIGMAASFFTGNLTVAYILGALLNAPLVLAVWAHGIFARQVAMAVKAWSVSSQFAEFGRGVINTGGLVYFLLIVAVMLYLSMVLIGRRLWHGGQMTLPAAVYYPLGAISWLVGLAAAAGLVSLIFWPSWVYFLITLLVFLAVAVPCLTVYVILFQGSWFPRQITAMPVHYAVRVVSLGVAAACLIGFFQIFNVPIDCTTEQLNSLSPDSIKLLENLDPKNPVYVEAFISEDVPELYSQTRLELLAMLRQLAVHGGKNVRLRINDTKRFSPEAIRANKRYGIEHHRVPAESRGVMEYDDIYLAVAFTCGLEKVVLPFIDRGIPIEYELVRSISTVTQQKRKKIGILRTDAPLYGRFNMQTMSSSREWPIVEELKKQYEVVEVDPTQPITEKYDALLAVQPSSLDPEAMKNFIAAVRSGQPTAIFEDPFPAFARDVPATSDERRPMGNPMFGGGQPQPKGDIYPLWRLLGVDFTDRQIIWQDYNPYPKVGRFDEVPEFVFVDKAEGFKEPFNESDAISSGLQHMLFPFPGAISKLNVSTMQFTPLVRTGTETGTVEFHDLMYQPLGPFGGSDVNPNREHVPGNMPYVLAAQITGKIPESPGSPAPGDEPDGDGAEPGAKTAAAAPAAAEVKPPVAETPETKAPEAPAPEAKTEKASPEEGASKAAEAPSEKAPAEEAAPVEKPAEPMINVVLVADIDMLTEPFFDLRATGPIPDAGINFDFDNVTFILNTLDSLAGDNRFIAIRKRRPQYRTLTRIDALLEDARKATRTARKDQQDAVDKARDKEQKILDDEIDKLRQDMKKRDISDVEIRNRLGMKQKAGQRRLDAKVQELETDRDKKIDEIDTKLKDQVRELQDWYKLMAVALPPMPPLALALIVLLTRRSREREGVSRSRFRS